MSGANKQSLIECMTEDYRSSIERLFDRIETMVRNGIAPDQTVLRPREIMQDDFLDRYHSR